MRAQISLNNLFILKKEGLVENSNSKKLEQVLQWISAILLFIMMVLTFVDVLGRYFFNAPIFGAAEMIQFLLAGTIFAALPRVSAENSHIAVNLFVPAITRIIPKTHNLIINLFSVVGLLIIGVEFCRMAWHALETERETVVLEWPLVWIVLFCGLCCFIAMAIQVNWIRESKA